jgi:hypothetical protein
MLVLLKVLNDERRLHYRDLKMLESSNESSARRPSHCSETSSDQQEQGHLRQACIRSEEPLLPSAPPNKPRIVLAPEIVIPPRLRTARQRTQRVGIPDGKILSSLILHKKADGADTKFAQSRNPMSDAPLETWLGVLECGAYKKNDPPWAFVRLDDTRNQEIEHDHDNSSDDSDTMIPTMSPTAPHLFVHPRRFFAA